jgi:sugar lactone lactonase YvrE
MRIRRALAWALLLAGVASGAGAQQLLYAPEGNRLRRIDIDTIGSESLVHDILIERALDGGLDINGQVCRLPDGRFVAGEDTGQPTTPAGWGVFEPDGTQVGKLTPTTFTRAPEPHGCALHPSGLLFTTEIGDIARGNGQLIVWFPPFDRFPGKPGEYPETSATSGGYCKLAVDLGTPGSVAIDAGGRVYVSLSSGRKILRFSAPFPRGPDAAGGCPLADDTGAPLAEPVQREVFAGATWFKGLISWAGLAFGPADRLYASSVLTGRIAELDGNGEFVRWILEAERLLPPHPTGNPQGLAVDAAGDLYYADLALERKGWFTIRPGPGGKIWRIRFVDGEPQSPEVVLDGLAFPDGLAVFPGGLD